MNKRARTDPSQIEPDRLVDSPADIRRVTRNCWEYICESKGCNISYGNPATVPPPGPKLLEAYVVSEDGREREDVLYRVLALYGIRRNWRGYLYTYRALLDARNVGGTMHMVFLEEPGKVARFDTVSSRRIESLDEVFNPPNAAAKKALEQRSAAFIERMRGMGGGMAYSN